MKLSIGPSQSILNGTKEQLELVHKHFSFTDKAAENQLHRWKKGLFWKEKALYSQHGELPDEYLKWKKNEEFNLKQNIKVHCCKYLAESGKEDLSIPTGLIPSLVELCLAENITLDVEDKRDWDLDKRLLTGQKPSALRKPQESALTILKSDRSVTHKGLGLIRLATGVGKTALAQELIRHFGVRSIFLVPSIPILEQTVTRFEAAFGKKNVTAYGGGKKKVGYVTVATYQSVYSGDPEEFKDIQLVVADEVHHCGADTFNEVLMNQLKNAVHRYGLTAFEERADNATMLIEAGIGPVIYQYDAPEAIADGFLAKPTFMFYDVYDTRGQWTKYKMKNKVRTPVKDVTSNRYDGEDDLEAYRNWVLGNDILNKHVADLTNAFVAEGQSVLILVDEKEHGERLMNLIPGAGYAVGGGKGNKQLQRDFNARKLKVLIGTSTLGEGADTVPVDVLINLQGGASKSKTLQAVGRGLRNEVDENGVAQKPNVLVVDFNFPLCKILSRWSGIRERICRTMGDVFHSRL